MIARMLSALGLLALFAGPATAASAQLEAGASAQGEFGGDTGADTGGDIEMGDIDDSPRTRLNAGTGPASRRSGGIRLGMQGRIDALNLLGIGTVGVSGVGFGGVGPDLQSLFVPIVTPGVRLLNSRLFLGLGLGFAHANEDVGATESSRSAFSLSPTALFDLISQPNAALSLGGWLNIVRLGETEECDMGGCMDQNDDMFGWGLNLGAGIRGKITEGLGIGSEFGWGFLDVSIDAGGDIFYHGLFGNIFFEASIGL